MNITSCNLKKTIGSIEGRPSLSVRFARLVAHEVQVQLRFEMAVEMSGRDEVLQRGGDRLVKAAELCRAEHR